MFKQSKLLNRETDFRQVKNIVSKQHKFFNITEAKQSRSRRQKLSGRKHKNWIQKSANSVFDMF